MAWETVTCSKCGEEYRVQLYGPVKTRNWKIDNWSGVCDSCKESIRQSLLEKNKSGEMVELTGSDKQIAWAMKIRANFIRFDLESQSMTIFNHFFRDLAKHYLNSLPTEEVENKMNELRKSFTTEGNRKKLISAAAEQFFAAKSAHEWIDNRSECIETLISKHMLDIFLTNDTEDIEKKLEADARAEAVMQPEKPVTETIADISTAKNYISVSFMERNDNFKKIIRDYGYRWDSPWRKNLSFATGSTDDRVAEIAHALLAAGFPVRVMNPDIRAKILAGDFTQEHTRWISVLSKKPKHFYVSWKYDDNLYKKAKLITGARYFKPGIIVPMNSLDEVLDFAKMYEYKFSPAAEDLIKKAEVNKAAAMVVNIKAKKKKELPDASGIPVLNIPENVEVDDDLKD